MPFLLKGNMGDIFSDERSEKIEARNKKRRDRDIDDIRQVLKKPEGRRFIWRYFGMTGVHRASFTPKDTNFTMFREGQRDIGLALLQDMTEADPNAYALMRKEFVFNQKSDKKEIVNDD